MRRLRGAGLPARGWMLTGVYLRMRGPRYTPSVSRRDAPDAALGSAARRRRPPPSGVGVAVSRPGGGSSPRADGPGGAGGTLLVAFPAPALDGRLRSWHHVPRPRTVLEPSYHSHTVEERWTC